MSRRASRIPAVAALVRIRPRMGSLAELAPLARPAAARRRNVPRAHSRASHEGRGHVSPLLGVERLRAMLEAILGDILVHDGPGTAGYYSPPFGRGGDAAVFSIEVTHRNGSPTLVFAVEHKSPEDTNWTSAGSTSVSSTGVATLDVSGLKEELRLKFTFSSGNLG